ncbi:MAG TPA: NACHT domain-containing protein [Thermoanaerobaculia bacterium]
MEGIVATLYKWLSLVKDSPKRLDPLTAAVTAFFLPVAYVAFSVLKKRTKDGARYVTEGVMYWCAHAVKYRFAGALTLKRFCRLQLSLYKYLYIPASASQKLPLDDVFVPLQLESDRSKSLSQADLLSEHNRVIVIGDPGSGKSSLIKWLFRDTCREAQKSPSRVRLPVLIELKTLRKPKSLKNFNPGLWLLQEIRKDVVRTKVYQMSECFDAYLRASGILVLLDGLDEVSIEQYEFIEEAICGLSRELSAHGEKNALILTMRTQFYQQVQTAYRDAFGPTLRLKPFTPSDIYEFLTRWPFGADADRNASKIYRQLTERPTLREMCRNPLVLSMYVAEAQETGNIVPPESRTDFYRRVTDELIIKRRLTQKQEGTVAVTKLREQRQRVLGILALDHLLDPSQPANLLQWSRGVEVVGEVTGCNDSVREIILREIAKETGLISEERIGETFRFIHLTFCEFLAAFEATEGKADGWNTLIVRHKDFLARGEPHLETRLIEVIPFASGLLKRVQRNGAIDDLAKLGDGRLLARSFLETKLYEHIQWAEFVRSEQSFLVGVPEQEWDEEWLERLYLFNIVALDALHSAEHIPRIERPVDLGAFFQELANSQIESLDKLLTAYASHDAAAAFRLAEVSGINLPHQFPELVITSCDQEPFLQLVLERICEGDGSRGSWLELLTESALRSRAVAKLMLDMEPRKEIYMLRKNLDKKYRWPYLVAGRNLLGQCLAVSLTRSATLRLSILHVMQKSVQPRVGAAYIATVLSGIPLLLAFLVFVMSARTDLTEFLIVIAAAAWSQWVLLQFGRTHQLLELILNIPESNSRFSKLAPVWMIRTIRLPPRPPRLLFKTTSHFAKEVLMVKVAFVPDLPSTGGQAK